MSNTAKAALQAARLYGILDLGYVAPSDAIPKTKALLQGGADVIQLRAKSQDLEVIQTCAEALLPLCRDAGIPFILNDFPELGVALGVDGIHIGQDDGDYHVIRELVGDDMILGRSTHSPEQALEALVDGFDYIGFGPLFPTPTKLGRPGIGLDSVSQVERTIGTRLPVFCIGGIQRPNLDQVLDAGARRVVMVSDLLQDLDTESATRMVKELLPSLPDPTSTQ